MLHRAGIASILIVVVAAATLLVQSTPACCPAGPYGRPVVNADQTVILIWDPISQTEHFIRKASFKSDADDFGFLVPTPKPPQLEESGNDAFPYFAKLTEPEIVKKPRPGGMACTCSDPGQPATKSAAAPAVTVRAEKDVAGFHAVVLESKSARELVQWLKEHGYAYSPEVEAWAKPYVEQGWMITALKVAKDGKGQSQNVNAAALRLSFQTDRPLFPYREPDPEKSAKALNANHRLLRIYFVAEGRYQGDLTKELPWSGKVAWSGKLSAEQRNKALELLKLPDTTGPAEWWLTEFEDNWPYKAAPADVYFALDANQGAVKRPPMVEYVSSPFPTDATTYALVAVAVLFPVVRRIRTSGTKKYRSGRSTS